MGGGLAASDVAASAGSCYKFAPTLFGASFAQLPVLQVQAAREPTTSLREVPMKTTRRITHILAAFGLLIVAAPQRADDPPAQEQGVDVLTRGPVHEAYASAVTAQPEAGPLVPKPPPNVIEELPPEE